MTIGVLGETDRAGSCDALNPRGDVAIAHQVAVGFLDHVAEMDADPKLDALVRRDPKQRFLAWPTDRGCARG